MCVKPVTTRDGDVVPCGRCNDCVAVKKWDWVARGVAETATNEWAGVVSLSYDNSELSKDGKVAFRYADVSAFFKRLRHTAPLRFLVAGERGSKRGRVHWHVLLWSPVNLFTVGEFADFDRQFAAGGLPSSGPDPRFKCEPAMRKRLVWSAWPFGHVFFDAVDQNSVEYVVKYAQKGMFNAVKSRGTKRFTKSEVSAAGMFRMSKFPPLGSVYLQQQIEGWRSKLHVPPTGHVTVSGMSGTWFPRKVLREQLFDGLASVYRASMEKRGAPPHGWRALIDTWSQTEAGLALVTNLMERIEPDELSQEAAQEETEEYVRENQRRSRNEARERAKINKCYRPYPCDGCLAALDAGSRRDLKQYGFHLRSAYLADTQRYVAQGGARPTFDAWSKARRQENPFCGSLGGDPPDWAKPTNGEKLYRHSLGEKRGNAAQRPRGQGRAQQLYGNGS